MSIQLGPKSGDDETNDEAGYHKTVDNKSASSHSPSWLKDNRPTPQWRPLDNVKEVGK